MLGILQVNTHEKYEIKVKQIDIKGVSFLEIIINYKKDGYFKNWLLKCACKMFLKKNVDTICADLECQTLFKKYNLKFANHFDVFYAKRYQVFEDISAGKMNIFVYSNIMSDEILQFLMSLPRKFDNIFLELGDNTKKISKELLKNYGVSVLDFNSKYNFEKSICVCFTKPLKPLKNLEILNFSKNILDIKCIQNIECDTPFYNGNTDTTAVHSAIVKANFKFAKNIKIKEIIRNT